MKSLFLLLSITLMSYETYSQVNMYDKPIKVNPKSTFAPVDLNQMQKAINVRQAKYDANLKYVDELIDWTYSLRSETNDHIFISKMSSYYKKLRSFDNKDLSIMTNQIRDVELGIKDEIYKYNARIRKIENASKSLPSKYKYSNQSVLVERAAKLKDKPDVFGKVLKIIPKGEHVIIVGHNNNYWKVFYEGKEGFIMEDLYFETTYKIEKFISK